VAHVLVVDDGIPMREVLRSMLEESGYVVSEAGDGAAALKALRASTVPLVALLDLDLPQGDGLDVLRAVAADTALSLRHRFILMTAVVQSRWEQASELRQRLHVPLKLKPFDVDDLLGVIGEAAEGQAPQA
jgi:two-component system chemotaxis response regulator CheY